MPLDPVLGDTRCVPCQRPAPRKRQVPTENMGRPRSRHDVRCKDPRNTEAIRSRQMQSDRATCKAYEQGQTQRDRYHALIFPIFPTIHSPTTKSRGLQIRQQMMVFGRARVVHCPTRPKELAVMLAVATSSGGASGWFKSRDADRTLVGSMRIGHKQDRDSMREEVLGRENDEHS